MQARGLLNYRLKYYRPKVIYCICEPNERKREIRNKTGVAKKGANQKSGWPTQAPLRITTGNKNKTPRY